jgi:hypothetical protein
MGPRVCDDSRSGVAGHDQAHGVAVAAEETDTPKPSVDTHAAAYTHPG